MSRVKTFDSTGVAPNGRLFAGDLNAIQDQYVDLVNLAQAVSVGSLTIGTAGLTFSQFAAGVVGLAGALRISNYANAVNGYQVNGAALASTHLADSANLARQSDISGVALPSGFMAEYAGDTAPTGWLLCDGSAVSRATYASLFGKLVTNKGNPTISIASPGVVTLNAHGLSNGDVVYFDSTGTLPTGITANAPYFVVNAATNTFQISTTKGGASVNTSGTQSGTHTLYRAPWALGTMSSTTFNVPDMRGRTPVGKNAATFLNLGAQGGEETHLLTVAEMAAHNHGGSTSSVSAGTPSGSVTVNNAGVITTGVESGDHTHAGGVDPNYAGATSYVSAVTTLDVTTGGASARVNSVTMTSSFHGHNFVTGGRSSVHTHDVPAHGHTASFSGTSLAPHAHTISSDGGGVAHNNLQPYTVVNYIIKT